MKGEDRRRERRDASAFGYLYQYAATREYYLRFLSDRRRPPVSSCSDMSVAGEETDVRELDFRWLAGNLVAPSSRFNHVICHVEKMRHIGLLLSVHTNRSFGRRECSDEGPVPRLGRGSARAAPMR